MPERHQRARLGEQQEQHPVDDRQRLLEAVLNEGPPDAAGPASVATSAPSTSAEAAEHAVAQRSADASRMPIGSGNQRMQRADRIVGR